MLLLLLPMLAFFFAKKLNHCLPLNLRVPLIVTAIAAGDDEIVFYCPKLLCNARSTMIISPSIGFPYLRLNVSHYKS
jgi:hypothetical protein